MISMSRVQKRVPSPRVCPICKGAGQVKRARGGIDACPHCTRIAEREWMKRNVAARPAAE